MMFLFVLLQVLAHKMRRMPKKVKMLPQNVDFRPKLPLQKQRFIGFVPTRKVKIWQLSKQRLWIQATSNYRLNLFLNLAIKFIFLCFVIFLLLFYFFFHVYVFNRYLITAVYLTVTIEYIEFLLKFHQNFQLTNRNTIVGSS